MNLLIIALIVVLMIIIFKKELEHKTTKIVVVIVIFLAVSLFFSYGAIKEQNIDLKSVSGIKVATGIYFNWMANALGNFKSITANAVKMNWSPNTQNSTK